MRRVLVFGLVAASALAQDEFGRGGPMQFMRLSPILNAVDANQDGTLSPQEIANAAGPLRKLDQNGDGKLSREEAGLRMQRRGRGGRGGEEPPATGPTATELTETLMMFDADKNGVLDKKEVPERMQGMFERGDTNHDGVLTREEIAKLAEANREQPGGGRGRGPGRGGPNQFDMAFAALDTDHNDEISADEISHASASLKALDRNGDGSITEEEVAPAQGSGRGRGPDRER